MRKEKQRTRSLIKALALVFTARAQKRERDVFWSDDARAEEKNRSERLVGCDCEQRRYLFRTHFAEIESNRYKILVRSEAKSQLKHILVIHTHTHTHTDIPYRGTFEHEQAALRFKILKRGGRERSGQPKKKQSKKKCTGKIYIPKSSLARRVTLRLFRCFAPKTLARERQREDRNSSHGLRAF
jgi:hypothetical protein